MNAVVETINRAGGAFVDFALPMLVQSSVLIVILLLIDAVLRRRVRAVFRSWIWMLVLVKLVLPPSLWSPVSIGRWLGDPSEATTAVLSEFSEPESMTPVTEPRSIAESVLSQGVAGFAAAVPAPVEDPSREAAMQSDTAWAEMDSEPLPGSQTLPPAAAPVSSLGWQGLVLLSWAAVAIALLLLLVQRSFFVRGLVAQADEPGAAMQDTLNRCRSRIGLRREVTLKLSAITGSPAACGLIHPVILIPQSLAPRLEGHDLEAVLLHELAHIKRGDLWVNLVQTLLQIVYFYNPLLWLANAIIRRTREQAVDEAVLVALGEAARQYPETLVNVAKLAFRKRPTLSLRLIGVVESKNALSARIKHILTRPLPKSTKLGVLSSLALVALAAVLLPMAKSNPLAGRIEGTEAPVHESEETTDNGSASSHLTAKLANGMAVELLGLFSGRDIDNLQWWYPDGTPIPAEQVAQLKERVGSNLSLTYDRLCDFAYLLQVDAAEDVTVRTNTSIKSRSRTSRLRANSYVNYVRRDWYPEQSRSPLPQTAEIRVTPAAGPYKTIETDFDPRKGYAWLQDGDYRFLVSSPLRSPYIDITLERDDVEVGFRHLASAEYLQSPLWAWPIANSSGPVVTYRVYLPTSRESLDRIVLDYRPASVAVFKNVSLRPGYKTNIEVEAGPVPRKPRAPLGPGPLGQHALSFDGVDDQLIVPPSPSLEFKGPLFLEMWLKVEPDASHYTLLMQKGLRAKLDQPQVGGFYLLGHRTSEPQMAYWATLVLGKADGRPGNQIDMWYYPPLEQSGWCHVFAGYDGYDYVPAPDQPLRIGRPGPQGSFRGEIAEIRIWNRALTDGEAYWYEAGSLTGNEPNLVACWDFERQPDGQIVYDISPNGNHAYLGTSQDKDDADPQWIQLTAGNQTSPAETSREISGVVVDPNGRPIMGAAVTVENKDLLLLPEPVKVRSRMVRMVREDDVRTDSSGRFVLTDLNPGVTDLRVRAGRRRTEFLRAIPVGTTDLRVVLGEPRPYTVSGVVVDEQGVGISDVSVTLISETLSGQDVGKDEPPVTVRTDATGAFRFDRILQPSVPRWVNRTLIARKQGYGLWGEEMDTTGGETSVRITLLPEEPPHKIIGPYFATIEVPPMAEAHSDEPLDLGRVRLTEDSSADASEMQLTPSQLGELKPAYQEYQQAVVGLLSAYDQAARAYPDFGAVTTGLLRIKLLGPLPGDRESTKYRNEDPEGWKKLREMAEGPAEVRVMGEHLSDPNLARQLRPALLVLYRAGTGWQPKRREKFMKELADRGQTVFDPNDPNDERLWQNIRRYLLERAENARRMEKRLLEEQGVPQWMLDHAGYSRFAASMGEWLDYSISMEMPDEVFDAAMRVDTTTRALSKMCPSWSRSQQVLAINASPGYDSAVTRVARWADDIMASTNRLYPSSSRIDPPPTDPSLDHRKAAYVIHELVGMFEEAGTTHRPSAESRDQYRQRRFVTQPKL